MLQAIFAFLVTATLIVAFRPFAPKLGLVDRPGGRKRHTGEIAVVGGLAMFGGYLAGNLFVPASMQPMFPALSSLALLVIVGATDDRFDLRPLLRLLVQFAAAILVVRTGGIAMDRVFTWNETSAVDLGAWGPAFTVLAIVAAINAYNLVDGLDGLAGGLGMIALAGFLALARLAPGQSPLVLAISLACAPLAAFLAFNAPLAFNRKIRCFMGDAGSTMLGLLVAWFGVRTSQEAQVAPVTILWFTAVPLMELVTSFARRRAQQRSPFSADADHFHHVLQRAGFSSATTCTILLGIAAAFTCCGLALDWANVNDVVSLSALVAMSAGTCAMFRNVEVCRRWLAFVTIAPRSMAAESLLIGNNAATQTLTTEESHAGRSG